MSRWIRLYYRDENKVMRALDGVKLAKGSNTIWIEQSVYTLSSDTDTYWIWLEKNQRYV